jgi:predicted SAM-dependent methyltransferase
MKAVKLHYGCGPRMLPGWVNIDGWPNPGIDLVTDLRQPLPLASGSCDFIFSEHVFEHIDRAFRLRVLREFHRLLSPAGVMRIVVPDMELAVDAYRRQDISWFDRAGIGGTTPAEGLNNLVSMHTHRFIDDWASLEPLLREAGFSKVERSTFNASVHPELRIDREEESRAISSLYVEARR